MTRIVTETPGHFDAIRQVTIDAFASSDLGHHGEADLIDAIRASGENILSLVAFRDEEVVGHVLFSPARLVTSTREVHGMALGPVSVRPSDQRQGVGSMLIQHGLGKIDETEAAFVVVAGHRDYYPRFGFAPASDFAIVHGFAEMPQEILFIRENQRQRGLPPIGGRVHFHPAFGPQFG